MSDILAEGRAKAEGYNRDGGGFQNLGRKNAYVCDGGHEPAPGKEGCGSFIVTVDRDYGVTPFALQCGNCGASAYSKFYRVAEGLEPTHEWYRPETLEGIDPAYHDHLSNGGIILRPIDGREDRWLRQADLGQQERAAQMKMLLERRAEMQAKLKAAEAQGPVTMLEKQLDRQLSRQERRWRDRKGLD